MLRAQTRRARAKVIFRDDVRCLCLGIEHDHNLAAVELTPDGVFLIVQGALLSTVVGPVSGHKLFD